MASVFDVAAYILAKQSPISAMKLQKLVYYSQAWSLAWDGRPMFTEPIQAWANGPVVADLYAAHRGAWEVVSLSRGSADNLDRDAKDTIDAVLDFYGKKSPYWLSELSHMEDPWREAYGDRRPGERCTEAIDLETMAEYYGGLTASRRG
jgi:uncharacterized phage-associated protein